MLLKRILSGGAMLLALFAAAGLLPPPGIGLLILALGWLGLIEFSRLLQKGGVVVFTGAMLFGATFLTGAAYFEATVFSAAAGVSLEIAALAAAFLMIMMLALLRGPEPATLTAAAASLLGLLYLPVMLNFYMRLALMDSGEGLRMTALFPIVAVKFSDIGAFFSGRLFGRHKLCPLLSPGKTWEGLAGGILFAVAAALICALAGPVPANLSVLWRPLPLAAAAVLLALTGVAGDLFESFLKRVAGVKDSSGAVPGMGGLLDVLDSLLFAAPVFYIIVLLTMGI